MTAVAGTIKIAILAPQWSPSVSTGMTRLIVLAHPAGCDPAMEPVGFDGDDIPSFDLPPQLKHPAMEPVGFDGDDYLSETHT